MYLTVNDLVPTCSTVYDHQGATTYTHQYKNLRSTYYVDMYIYIFQIFSFFSYYILLFYSIVEFLPEGI